MKINIKKQKLFVGWYASLRTTYFLYDLWEQGIIMISILYDEKTKAQGHSHKGLGL